MSATAQARTGNPVSKRFGPLDAHETEWWEMLRGMPGFPAHRQAELMEAFLEGRRDNAQKNVARPR